MDFYPTLGLDLIGYGMGLVFDLHLGLCLRSVNYEFNLSSYTYFLQLSYFYLFLFLFLFLFFFFLRWEIDGSGLPQ